MKNKNWTVLAGTLVLACAGIASGGTNVWTEVGPLASDVKVRFSNADTAYARGGDGFWKSTNGGQSWVSLASRNSSFYPFAVDPTNPNVVLLGADSFGGLLRSADGGQTFTQISFASFYALEFSADASVAYGVNNFVATEITRSTDKGVTWTARTSTGLPVLPSGTSGLVPVPYSLGIDSVDTAKVYAGFRHPDFQGIYRSTDSGDHWTAATGLQGISVNQIAPHPTITGRVLVATSAGVFQSVNAGVSFTRVTDPGTTGVATLDMQSVAFDRMDPRMIYAGGAQRGEIFFSSDGGSTWARRDSGVLANKINSLAPRPGHGGELLAGTSFTMYRSTNSAQNWTVSANGIRAANVESLYNGSRLFAGLSDGGIFESTDGSTWTPLNNAALRATMPGTKFSNITDILEGNRLFAVPLEGGVLSSTTSGTTWEPIPPSYPSYQVNHFGGLLTLSGSGPVHLAGSNYGVYKTFDDGVTWSWSSSGLPPTQIRKLVMNGNGSAIYAATFANGVYKSIDSGASWLPMNNGLTNLNVNTLAYDTANDVLLVGTIQGLFASNNGGTSYTALTDPWDGQKLSVDAIVVEDFVHGALYAGVQRKLFRSVDSGVTWTELSEGNANSTAFVRITSMVSDGPGALYVGYWAGGIESFTVSPDIRMEASAPANGNVAVGSEIPWQFTVRNAGPHASTFTQASWQVPANVDLLNLAPSRGTCAVSGSHRLSCDFGVLPANQSVTVTLKLRGNAGGTLGINLSASSAETDSAPANNNFTNSGVRFVESVDLAATLTIAPLLVNSGTPLEYTLVVSNNGPNPASGGTIETNFDARDQYVLAQGSLTGCTGNVAGLQVCPLPTIASGGSRTYRWTVTPQWGGVRTPGVIVRPDTQNSLDTNQVNNTANATANVVPITNLAARLTSLEPTAVQGLPFALSGWATNNSLIDAAGVTTTLTLSDRMSFVSATGAVCTSTGNTVVCAIGVLEATESRLITFNVNPVAPGTATSTLSIVSAGPDPVLLDNSSNYPVTIVPSTDLSVTLAGANSALTGNPVVLTLTGNNLSANEATGVRADVTLSTLFSYVSASGATCTTAAAVVSCDFGTLAANSSKAVSITVNAVNTGTATNSATITAATPDPIAANNTSSAQTTLTAPPPPSGGGSSGGGGGGGGGGALDWWSLFALVGVLASMQSRRRRSLRLI